MAKLKAIGPRNTKVIREETLMTIESPKELFELLLSDARQGADGATEVLQELSQAVQDTDIREALEARVFISGKIISALDQCLKLVGAQPVELSGHLHDVFVDEFRKQLVEIKSPTATRLFVLAKANQLTHLRIGEYVALIASADMTGHCGVVVLLESCLADHIAFVERTRRLIGNIVEGNGVKKPIV
jgi:ferritin-like metal-binding protein YciE